MAGNASVPSAFRERERVRHEILPLGYTESVQPLFLPLWLWQNERCKAGTIRTSGSHGYSCQSLRLVEHLSHLTRRLIPSPLKLAVIHKDLPPRGQQTAGCWLIQLPIKQILRQRWPSSYSKSTSLSHTLTHTHTSTHKQRQILPLFTHKVKGTITDVIHIQAVNGLGAISLTLCSQYTQLKRKISPCVLPATAGSIRGGENPY